jgi:hypothetical protein
MAISTCRWRLKECRRSRICGHSPEILNAVTNGLLSSYSNLDAWKKVLLSPSPDGSWADLKEFCGLFGGEEFLHISPNSCCLHRNAGIPRPRPEGKGQKWKYRVNLKFILMPFSLPLSPSDHHYTRALHAKPSRPPLQPLSNLLYSS